MTALQLKVSRAARRDLVEISRFTLDRWGEEQLRRYLTQLDTRIRSLAKNPKQGRPCAEIRPGYWFCHEGRHVIFYKGDKRTVLIVRVLHDQMLPKRHL